MPNPIQRHRPERAMNPAANRSGREADNRRTLSLHKEPWQRLRAAVLADEPLCRHCASTGAVVPATDVDHLSGDPSDNSRENLQPLCHACHSRKTATDHGGRVASGCDASGYPLPAVLQKSPATEPPRPSCSLNAHRRNYEV